MQRMAALLLIALPLAAQEVLTADAAIREGLSNNFAIRIARNGAVAAQNSSGLGQAEFLPTLDVSGSYQVARTDQETNSPFSFGDSDTRTYSGLVSLNWTLFDGFSMFAEDARYEALAALGAQEARERIESTVVLILSTYFNLVQQEQLMEVAAQSRAISEERLKRDSVRAELGGAWSTDLLNSQVSYNTDAAALLNQELQVLIARQDLNISLGREPHAVVRVVDHIDVPPLILSLDSLQRLATESNSTINIARYRKRAAEQAVRTLRARFLPELSLFATYGYTSRLTRSTNPNFLNDIETESFDGTLGLALTFNLFDGFRDRINLQNSRIEANNEQLSLDQARLAIAGALEEVYITFRKRMELIGLEEQNVTAAQQNLAVQQERYRMGSSTALELRDAQVNLLRASNSLIVATFQARITRLLMDQLTGRLTIERSG